jgi:hypothetical protein
VTLEKVKDDEWQMIGYTWVADWLLRFLMFFHKHFLGDSPIISDIKELEDGTL